MNKKSSNGRTSLVLSVIICLVAAFIVWLYVGYMGI